MRIDCALTGPYLQRFRDFFRSMSLICNVSVTSVQQSVTFIAQPAHNYDGLRRCCSLPVARESFRHTDVVFCALSGPLMVPYLLVHRHRFGRAASLRRARRGRYWAQSGLGNDGANHLGRGSAEWR